MPLRAGAARAGATQHLGPRADHLRRCSASVRRARGSDWLLTHKRRERIDRRRPQKGDGSGLTHPCAPRREAPLTAKALRRRARPRQLVRAAPIPSPHRIGSSRKRASGMIVLRASVIRAARTASANRRPSPQAPRFAGDEFLSARIERRAKRALAWACSGGRGPRPELGLKLIALVARGLRRGLARRAMRGDCRARSHIG